MRGILRWLGLAVGAFCVVLYFWQKPRQVLLGWVLGPAPTRTSPGFQSPHAPSPPLRRVAIGTMISPARTIAVYSDLFHMIGQQMGEEVTILLKKTYREVNELLLNQEVDVAWICTGGWRELRESGKVELLAVPQVNGQTSYRSYLVVRSDAPYQTLAQLQGGRIVYSDPLSLTGCRIPRQMFEKFGFTPESFFSKSFFSFSHDASLWAVRRSLADVAGVDSLVFDFLKTHSPEEVAGLRIISISEELPIPPLVVGTWVPGAERQRWQGVLTSLHEDPQGAFVLRRLGIDRFVLADPQRYQALP